MADNTIYDVAMQWDDEIQNDGNEYRVLPAGEYDFEVTGFTRGRHEGSSKMGPCPKAELEILIHSSDGNVTIKHNLFLNRKCEWALCAFFTAIKARMPGEALRMNWSRVKGAKGRCEVGIRKWTGNDGKEHETNEIVKFINPFKGKNGFDVENDTNSHIAAHEAHEARMETQKKWTPGSFGA